MKMKDNYSDSEELNMEEDNELMEIDSQENNSMEEEEKEHIVKQDQKKHKKSFDPRFSVPTYEEKQMMRNADMEVEISMLEIEVSLLTGSFSKSYILQAQQYVENLDTKHMCEERISEYMKSINTFLTQLPEKDVNFVFILYYQITIKDVNTKSLFQRTISTSGESKELKLRFCKPSAVYVVGSYVHKTTTSFPMTIDMTLQLSNVM